MNQKPDPLFSKHFTRILFLLWLWLSGLPGLAQAPLRPDEQLGELFEAVQLKPVFPDSKTFPDCIARSSPEVILQAYRDEKAKPGFDLKAFVLHHFQLPPEPASGFQAISGQPVQEHINRLWPVLTREPRAENSSLIPLPQPYIVPGGRFREIYYWDSYFTMLGLQVSGQTDIIEHMVDNFAHLLLTAGHIPNGNRSYYLSRSQPPFFALMVNLLAETKGPQVLAQYLPALEKEYAFWMDGAGALTAASPAHRRVVRLPDGRVLNRYWDDSQTPRPEAYKEDVHLARESGRDPKEVYRHLKAAAESGWDFSTRWFADGKTLKTIHTTEIVPVDLNALLYYMEQTLARMHGQIGNKEQQRNYEKQARARRKALLKYCWNKSTDYFHDYDLRAAAPTPVLSLAAVYPLYFGMAKKKQAVAVARKLQSEFLRPGGLVTTPQRSGEQWDAPNGWAPLQWLAIGGLRRYGQQQLADEVAARWTRLNVNVYQRTGKLVEKYNVEDLSLKAGGGEYPLQDGFGWTNGVLLRLLSEDGNKSGRNAN